MSKKTRTTDSYAATAATKTTRAPKARRGSTRDYDGKIERVDATDGFCVAYEYTPSGRKGDT